MQDRWNMTKNIKEDDNNNNNNNNNNNVKWKLARVRNFLQSKLRYTALLRCFLKKILTFLWMRRDVRYTFIFDLFWFLAMAKLSSFVVLFGRRSRQLLLASIVRILMAMILRWFAKTILLIWKVNKLLKSSNGRICSYTKISWVFVFTLMI
jgi:hypothetical protein